MPVNGTDLKYRMDQDSSPRCSVSYDTGPSNRQSQAASNEQESNDVIPVTNLLEKSDFTSFNLKPLGLRCYLKIHTQSPAMVIVKRDLINHSRTVCLKKLAKLAIEIGTKTIHCNGTGYDVVVSNLSFYISRS